MPTTVELRSAEALARELATERERLQITLASIADGVISTDAEGTVVFLNAVASDLTGVGADDASGQPIEAVFRIINGTTRDPTPNPVREALDKRHPVELANNTLLLHRDGSERPIDDSAAPMIDADGRVVGGVLVFRDVTERKQREAEQAHLAAIIQSSDDAIVSKSLDGIVRSWNAGATRMFGYEVDEIVGKSITMIIPSERLDEETMILDRLRRGERIDHFETVRRRKDGALLDISVTVSPLRDSAGNITGASKVARDISSRKRMERELQARAAELAASDQRKDNFIALLAHELRNPLSPIAAGLEVMRLAPDDIDAVEQSRAVMERQLKHVVRIIDDLLDVSRLNNHKLHLKKARVALAEVVRHAVEASALTIGAAGHQLTIDLPELPVRLNGDLTRLTQVLANLLNNSAKYTPRGGHIRLSARVDGGFVEIVVADDGIGIPHAALARIFDLFSQVERPIERVTGGLGIGLALVKGLTEAHGGTVCAESKGPGEGATFTVRLPVLEHESGAVHRAATPRPSVPAHTVLLVEDDDDGAAVLSALLRLLGQDTHRARDGLEAVDAAEQLRPDLILMDVGMPRLGGLEATRRIRAMPWGKSIRIVAVTGFGQDADRERSRAAGCDDHLVKPLESSALTALLASLPSRPRPPAEG